MRATPSEYFTPSNTMHENPHAIQYVPLELEPTQADLVMPIVAIAIVAGLALGIGVALLLRKR